MIDELQAMRERIRALGINAHIGQVPAGTQMPYASLSAPGTDLDAPALAGPCGRRSADVRVMVTHTTESNVYRALDKIRDDLWPDEHPSHLLVPGRYVTADFVRSEFVTTDRDLTFGDSNRHPGYGVDTYHVDSQPT